MTRISPKTIVLVEGQSDQAALETLARRRSRDLASEGTTIVSMGGATNVGHFLRRFGPAGDDLRLAGLCDVGEERKFRSGLERAGLGSNLDRKSMERLGFFVCVLDLEDEMIRSLGPRTVEGVIEDQRELGSFRVFQRQPAQRERPIEAQLRRFLGTHSGRKIAYGALLAEALDLDRVPRPLDAPIGSRLTAIGTQEPMAPAGAQSRSVSPDWHADAVDSHQTDLNADRPVSISERTSGGWPGSAMTSQSTSFSPMSIRVAPKKTSRSIGGRYECHMGLNIVIRNGKGWKHQVAADASPTAERCAGLMPRDRPDQASLRQW